jgi:hypothetical protein
MKKLHFFSNHMDDKGSISGRDSEEHFSLPCYIQTSYATQPTSIQWVLVAHSPGIKWLEHEAELTSI